MKRGRPTKAEYRTYSRAVLDYITDWWKRQRKGQTLDMSLLVTVVVINCCSSWCLPLEMNYSLTCQINNDWVFSGLLSPCPTYRFWGGRGHIIWKKKKKKACVEKIFLVVGIHWSGHTAPRWGKLAVICCHFRDCFWKIGTLNEDAKSYKKKEEKKKPPLKLDWSEHTRLIWQFLLKWNVANGGGEK